MPGKANWNSACEPWAGRLPGCSMCRLPPAWRESNTPPATVRSFRGSWAGRQTRRRPVQTGGVAPCLSGKSSTLWTIFATCRPFATFFTNGWRISAASVGLKQRWRRGKKIQWSLSQERWRRVSGNSGLTTRCLAIVRELWRWREAEAERRDCPARRVLRDDLLIELAKRQTADLKRILAVRGLERGDLKRQLPKIAEAIERGLTLAVNDLPPSMRHDSTPQLSVLGQFLFSALGSICRRGTCPRIGRDTE